MSINVKMLSFLMLRDYVITLPENMEGLQEFVHELKVLFQDIWMARDSLMPRTWDFSKPFDNLNFETVLEVTLDVFKEELHSVIALNPREMSMEQKKECDNTLIFFGEIMGVAMKTAIGIIQRNQELQIAIETWIEDRRTEGFFPTHEEAKKELLKTENFRLLRFS